MLLNSHSSVLQERLNKSDVEAYRGVLLDGFPRTLPQATTLLHLHNLDIDRFILIQALDEVRRSLILYCSRQLRFS